MSSTWVVNTRGPRLWWTQRNPAMSKQKPQLAPVRKTKFVQVNVATTKPPQTHRKWLPQRPSQVQLTKHSWMSWRKSGTHCSICNTEVFKTYRLRRRCDLKKNTGKKESWSSSCKKRNKGSLLGRASLRKTSKQRWLKQRKARNRWSKKASRPRKRKLRAKKSKKNMRKSKVTKIKRNIRKSRASLRRTVFLDRLEALFLSQHSLR